MYVSNTPSWIRGRIDTYPLDVDIAGGVPVHREMCGERTAVVLARLAGGVFGLHSSGHGLGCGRSDAGAGVFFIIAAGNCLLVLESDLGGGARGGRRGVLGRADVGAGKQRRRGGVVAGGWHDL